MKHLKTLTGVDASRPDPEDTTRSNPHEIAQAAYNYAGFPAGVKYVFVEPKIDGYRLLAYVKNGKVTFSSRRGHTDPYTKNFAFVGKQLLKMGFKSGMVDGEIIVAKKFGRTGLARKKSLTPAEQKYLEKNAVFWVFDYTDTQGRLTQAVRSKFIKSRIGRGSKNVAVIPQFRAKNEAEVRALFKQARAKGYEGVMVKLPSATYQQRRTWNWLKIKEFKTIDAKISGFGEGKGSLRGSLGKFYALLPNGKKISAGGIPHALGRTVWANKKRFLGKWIEVKSQVSKDHTAFHFVRMRDDMNVAASKPTPKPTRKPVSKPTRKPTTRAGYRPSPVTEQGYGRLVSPQAVASAVMRFGLKFDPTKPIVRITVRSPSGKSEAVLIDVSTRRTAIMSDRGVYRHAKATKQELDIAKRTIVGVNAEAKDLARNVRHAGGKLSDAEITKKFKSCIRQVNEREARKYAEGQPPDAFVDIDKAHAVCRSRFNAKYGSDTMKRVVAAMRSSGSYVKATPEHIRRKYLSCIKQMTEKNPNNKFIYATCAGQMNKTYGPDAAKKALAPIRAQAALDAAKTRARKKARKNPPPTLSPDIVARERQKALKMDRVMLVTVQRLSKFLKTRDNDVWPRLRIVE